jgi:LysR family transcriptional regulator for bpeEF and oprC
MEDFSAISTFVRVVEAKSFAAAATQLGMTPSGVSRAVSRLETQLGTRLLSRSTRSLRLTDDGASFHARCKEILADLAEATEALGHARIHPVGKLRVATHSAIGRSAIIPNLVEFEARYPDIRLELSMCDYAFDLNEEGYDCAIRMGELEDSSLIARKLGYFANVLCAAPSYLSRHGVPQTIEDLRKHHCINYIFPSTGKAYQWQFETPSGRVELDIDAHMLINDGESVIQAAVAGLGIIQIPHCLAAVALARGELEIVMPDTISTGSPLWIVYPQKRHLSARVQAFIEWVSELFQRTCEPQCRINARAAAEKTAAETTVQKTTLKEIERIAAVA